MNGLLFNLGSCTASNDHNYSYKAFLLAYGSLPSGIFPLRWLELRGKCGHGRRKFGPYIAASSFHEVLSLIANAHSSLRPI